ncbi:MAG: hypothetical protein AB1445_00175 [Bacillota bacterium]
MRAKDRVLDAIDVETFLVCEHEEDARTVALALAADMGLRQADIVFVEWRGLGARVRIRAYVHRPGDRYGWMHEREGGDGVGGQEGPAGTA